MLLRAVFILILPYLHVQAMRHIIMVALAVIAVAGIAGAATANDAEAQCRAPADLVEIDYIHERLDALEARIAYLEQQRGDSLMEAEEREQRQEEMQQREEQRLEELVTFDAPTNQPADQYYVRILNDMSATYSIGDRIHFEAAMPQCPNPTYDDDGNLQTGSNVYVELSLQDVTTHIGIIECNRDAIPEDSDLIGLEATGTSTLDASDDLTAISGSVVIDEIVPVPNKAFVRIHVSYDDGTDSEYYSGIIDIE